MVLTKMSVFNIKCRRVCLAYQGCPPVLEKNIPDYPNQIFFAQCLYRKIIRKVLFSS